MSEVAPAPSAEVVVRLRDDLDLAGRERWDDLLHDAVGLVGPDDETDRASRLVLDLGDVDFADCTGLALLEELSTLSRGRLVLRHPSPAVRRILRLTSSEGFLLDEDVVAGLPGAEDGAGPRSDGVDGEALRAGVERLAADLATGAATADVLAHLTAAAARVVDLDGAGVMLVGPDDRLRLAHAQGEGVREVELVQDRLELGPCRDSHGTGDVVDAPDLTAEGAWPAFRESAVAVGLRGVTAVPLRARGRGWGVLDVYRRAPRPLGADELAALRALASVATSCLVVEADRRAGSDAEAASVSGS